MFASPYKLHPEKISFRHAFNALDLNDRQRNSTRKFRPVSKGLNLKIEAVIPSLQGDASSQAPPDLPSYIFKERIVYLGMTLVPSVTSLYLLNCSTCNTRMTQNQYNYTSILQALRRRDKNMVMIQKLLLFMTQFNM